MIIEMYILFQIFLLVLMALGWFNQHPIFWAMGFVFGALQVFTSYSIEYVIHSVDFAGVVTTTISTLYFPILSYVNILLSLLCFVFFFVDIFYTKETSR